MRRKFALSLLAVCVTFAFFPMMELVYFAAMDGQLERTNVWTAFALILAPNLVGWLMGAFVGTKWKPVFLLLPPILTSLAGGAYLLYHVQIYWVGAAVWTIGMLVSSILTTFKVYSNVLDMRVTHLALAGLILFGAQAFAGAILWEGYERVYAQLATEVIKPLAVFWLLATIWIAVYYHAQSLNASRGRKTPRRVVVFNCVIAGVFTLLVLGVYHIDALRQAMVTLFLACASLFFLFSELIARLIGAEEPTGEIGDGGGMGDIGEALGAEAHVENLFDIIFMRVMLVIVILLLVAAAIFLTWQLVKFIRHLIRRMNGFLNSWEVSNQSYQDEQEDLMNAAIFRQEMGERIERMKKRFRRKPKLEDMPDDRARVRALYRWMLERSARKGEYNAALTSKEYLSGHFAGEEGESFSAAYDRARYSEHEAVPEDVRMGENLYRRS